MQTRNCWKLDIVSLTDALSETKKSETLRHLKMSGKS